jgi:hypothetical protein
VIDLPRGKNGGIERGRSKREFVKDQRRNAEGAEAPAVILATQELMGRQLDLRLVARGRGVS